MNTEALIGHHVSMMGAPAPVTQDIAWLQTVMVNVLFVTNPDGSWVLVDAGLPYFTGRIKRAAESLFGGAPPAAIVLTHGHFDHVGCIELADEWDVPVWAHELEMPYLTGRCDYPPPDPSVGGGLMARTAMLYPRGAVDLGERARVLPEDGTVPPMPGWRWIHTPGHTPGHVSLFRDEDRVLLAGDAFCTQKQESAVAVMSNHQQVHGPPAYFTTDWLAAEESVRKLVNLHPLVAATGHGIPMRGERLAEGLTQLAAEFRRLAVPSDGRYVREPARADASGVTYVPPPVPDPVPKMLGAAVLVGVAAFVLTAMGRDDRS